MNNTEKELEAMQKKDKINFGRIWHCKEKNCGSLMKNVVEEVKLYHREVRQKCRPNKSAKFSKRYLDCLTDMHNKTELKNLEKKLNICGKKKCSKYEKTRKNIDKKLMKLYKKLK